MKRATKIKQLKGKFATTEIFCPHVVEKFGESAWQYLSNEFVDMLHFFRFTLFKKPITINQPSRGRVQRGVRCNVCPITKAYTARNEAYLTGHALDGCDMDVEGLTAAQARKVITDNTQHLPHSIRLKKNVNYVHWDKRNYTGRKISWF
jgi:hypothetical protein